MMDVNRSAATWTAEEVRDVMIYGKCWCGAARAASLEHDPETGRSYTELRCRAGHVAQ